MNRQGVSEIVANVLIVLLVIVGICVIWSVVKPAIDQNISPLEGKEYDNLIPCLDEISSAVCLSMNMTSIPGIFGERGEDRPKFKCMGEEINRETLTHEHYFHFFPEEINWCRNEQ